MSLVWNQKCQNLIMQIIAIVLRSVTRVITHSVRRLFYEPTRKHFILIIRVRSIIDLRVKSIIAEIVFFSTNPVSKYLFVPDVLKNNFIDVKSCFILFFKWVLGFAQSVWFSSFMIFSWKFTRIIYYSMQRSEIEQWYTRVSKVVVVDTKNPYSSWIF